MDQLDLDLDNYQLNDLLKLFKLPKNFDEQDLKEAKKIVLKMHPDKSNLEPKYFIFFSKAYKMLIDINTFQNKSDKKQLEERDYENNSNINSNSNSHIIKNNKEDSSNEKRNLDNFFKNNEKMKDSKNFNKWFNEQFEKTKLVTEEESRGYGDWLRSDEDVEPEKNISKSQMNEEFENKKRNLKSIIKYNDYTDYNNTTFSSNITGDAPDEFSSDVFSNLQYQDLRKAHRESIIPISNEDYNKREKFSNINEYTTYRNSQNTTPLSEKQALEYLNKRNNTEDIESRERAFRLAKQAEEITAKNDIFWSNIKTLKN